MPVAPNRLSVSVLLTLLAGGGACGGGENLTGPTTGRLEVTTSTTGAEPDTDGYAVQVDTEAPQAIGTSASRTTDLPPGDHTVQLAGLSPNCTVSGENPRPVTVAAGKSATVIFAVTCGATSGDLQVTSATGGPSPDPDGYAITVDGVDRGTLGPSGAVSIPGLAAGQYLVGLSGVSGNCQVQGDNPQSVTLTAGQSATVAFTVTCSAAPASAGTLRIVTATTGAEPDPNGYAFAVDGGATQPIGMNATATVTDVATGNHTVELAGLATNCSVEGESPRSVTVTAGATTATTFNILCRSTQGTKIAFLSDRDGSYDIFVMNPDGTEQKNLTSNPANDVGPVWSPDGSRLAFQSDREHDLLGDIFVMNPDGSGLTNLTRNPESDIQPAWSPDGRRMAFTSGRNGNFQVFVMNADGSEQRSLTPDQNGNELPAWSSDGARITFIRGARIYVMNANGTGQTQLTSASGNQSDIGYSWSPDGSRIAFIRVESDENENSVSNLWIINTDGSNERNLTNFALGPGVDIGINGFSWAPDGSKLGFASTDDIFVIRPDGTGLVNLTNSTLGEYAPSWSRDGTRISFSALVGDAPDVFVMNADGSNPRNLTNNPAYDAGVAWSP